MKPFSLTLALSMLLLASAGRSRGGGNAKFKRVAHKAAVTHRMRQNSMRSIPVAQAQPVSHLSSFERPIPIVQGQLVSNPPPHSAIGQPAAFSGQHPVHPQINSFRPQHQQQQTHFSASPVVIAGENQEKRKWHDGLGALAAQMVVASTIDSVIRTAITIPLTAWMTSSTKDPVAAEHRCHFVETPGEDGEGTSSNALIMKYCPPKSQNYWTNGPNCQSSDTYPTVKYQSDSLLICPSVVPPKASITLCC